MSNYTKFLTALMALAVLAASVRHYGSERSANSGWYIGCLGWETQGDPGPFVDCGENDAPAVVR